MQKLPAEILSTKIKKVDEITGIGGFVKGHIVELCGEESCGKTALALTIANNISKQRILFVDTEHTADTKFFSLLGIDVNKILLCQPDNIDVALGVIKKLVSKKLVDCVIVDTMSAIVSQYELEQELLSNFLQAGHYFGILKFMRSLAREIRRTGCIGILVDQVRAVFHRYKQTVVGYDAISVPINFFTSRRILMTLKRYIVRNSQKVGFVVNLKVLRNKFASPSKECQLTYYFTGKFC